MVGKVSSQKENINKKISWWERFKTMNALQGGDPDTPIFTDYRDMQKADNQEATKLFEEQNKAASELDIKKGKATVNALALIGGLKNPFGLLGDLGITTAATLADTALDGNVDNLTKNLATNAMFDIAGKGVGDVLGYVGKKAAPHVLRILPERVVQFLNKTEVPNSTSTVSPTRTSKLSEAERLGIPKGERNQPLNGHLKGERAVEMFREYGGISIPEDSKISADIYSLVEEARERYGLIGNTSITDKEIAEGLYKRALDLRGSSAAVHETGEPILLFRGDTRRYNSFKQRYTPEELATMRGTMDNSLGNLFLDYPREYQGADRYLGTAWDRNGISIHGSATGSEVKRAVGTSVKTTDELPEGTRLLYSGHIGKHNAPISVYKLPGSSMESGINDLNAFVVRTDDVRDATSEISVLGDNILVTKPEYHGKSKLVTDSDGFPEFVSLDGSRRADGLAGSEDRLGMAEHYRWVLDDAQKKSQGLFVSKKESPIRFEHRGSNYYAVPNYNIQNVKHLFGWDLRRPIDWSSTNVYLKSGGQIKPNFIKRLEDPNRKFIPDWTSFYRNPLFNNRGEFTNNYVDDLINSQHPSISTHKMGYEYAPDDTGRAIAYPEVQEVNGKLVDFTRPPHHSWAGYDSALDRGDYLMMKDLEEARKWVEGYKDKYKNLK